MSKICPECKARWPDIYNGCPYCVIKLEEGKYSKKESKGAGLSFKFTKPPEITEPEKVPDEHYSQGKRCIETDCRKPITNTSTRCRQCAGRLIYSEGEKERLKNQRKQDKREWHYSKGKKCICGKRIVNTSTSCHSCSGKINIKSATEKLRGLSPRYYRLGERGDHCSKCGRILIRSGKYCGGDRCTKRNLSRIV